MLSTRDRRALFLGGAVVATAVLGLRVVPWAGRTLLVAHGDLRDRATLLARSRAELAQVRLLEDSAVVLARTIRGLATRVLDGGSAAEAGADLAARLNLATARAPARLVSVDQLGDSARAGVLQRVRARASVETDVRGLATFLRAVEFGDAALSVEHVTVVSPSPGSEARVAESLHIEITVAGWFLARTGNAVRTGG